MELELTDILSEPTQTRAENSPSSQENEVGFSLEEETTKAKEESPLEFSEPEEPGNDFEEEYRPRKPKKVLPPDYDAEEEANKIISMINAGNILAMNPLADWKVRKKRGGKEAILKLQEVMAKEYAGKKLTEDEQRKVNQYNAYLRDKEELHEAIPYTEKEQEQLKQLAIPYCKATGISINAGMGFWMTLGVIQSQRIFKILQA